MRDLNKIESCLKVLTNGDLLDRLLALSYLRDAVIKGDSIAVDCLTKTLNDDDYRIRYTSAECLGKIGDPRALEPLRCSLDENDVAFNLIIKKAIEKIQSGSRAPSLKYPSIETKTIDNVAENALAFFGESLYQIAVRIFTPGQHFELLETTGIQVSTEMRQFIQRYERRAMEKGLYSHQICFLREYLHGGKENFILTSGTGSGKSLCFWFWIFDHLLKDDTATALLCFPTQALIYSQANRMEQLSEKDSLITYNDTKISYAGAIKLGEKIIRWSVWMATYNDEIMKVHQEKKEFREARIRICTIDKAHWSLMKGNKFFLGNLKCLVLDEAHLFNGMFGANINYFLKRLYMAKEILGKQKPRIFLSSATLASPKAFAQTLLSMDNADKLAHIDDTVRRSISCIPISEVPTQLKIPPKDGMLRLVLFVDSNKKKSLIPFIANDTFIGDRINIIYFSPNKRTSRKMMQRIEANNRHAVIYDANLTPRQRRETERIFNDPTIKGMTISTTSALEVGVDIQELDLCIMEDVPCNKSAMLQRIGRVGRQIEHPGLVLMKLTSSLNDRNILEDPENAFQISHKNPIAIPLHLEIVKWEHAIIAGEEWRKDLIAGSFDHRIFEASFKKHFINTPIDYLELDSMFKNRYGELINTNEEFWQYRHFRPSIGEGTINISMDGETIGVINKTDIFRDAHPGAIYNDYKGKKYRVYDYDINGSNQEISDSIASLRCIKAIYVREELNDISTYGYAVQDFCYENDMNLPERMNSPNTGAIKFGIWKYTLTWRGYYENERLEIEGERGEGKKAPKKKSFMELPPRFVPSDMIDENLKEKFPFIHSYRTMGWEWDFSQNHNEIFVDHSWQLDYLVARILNHFLAYAVESETNEIDVSLNLLENKLRVVDANPGGNGLSEALLLDGRMMNALSECEIKLSDSDYENEYKFKKYIKQLCQLDPAYSAKEVLAIIQELHKNWGKLNASTLNDIGASNCEKGNTEKAISFFEKALEIEPNCIPAQMNKGKAYAKLGKYSEAICCFNSVIKLNKKNCLAWKENGKAYFQLKNYIESIKCFQFVLDQNSEDATAWSNLGIALLAQGSINNNRALECFNKALEINPRYTKARYCRNIVIKRLGLLNTKGDSETRAGYSEPSNELNYFKLVDETIQSVFDLNIPSTNEKDLTEMLKTKEREMQRRYYNDEQIAYSDDYNQIIYLYKYVPCHADLIKCIFDRRDTSLKDFFYGVHSKNNYVNVAIVGCGPGTELLGLANWVERQYFDVRINLKISLLDQISEWERVCRTIAQQIYSNYQLNLNLLEVKFHLIGAGNPLINNSRVYELIEESDIYIMSYVFSEIIIDKFKVDKFSDLIHDISHHGKNGSKVIFIDRNEYRIRNELERIARSVGLSDLLISQTFQDLEYTFPEYADPKFNFKLNINIGQVFNLSDFWKFIGSNYFSPKLKANAFWIVGTVKNK